MRAVIAAAVLMVFTTAGHAAQAPPPRPPTNTELLEIFRYCEARLRDRIHRIAEHAALRERMKIKTPHKAHQIAEIRRIMDDSIRRIVRVETLTKMILLNLAYSLSTGREKITFGHFVKHASCTPRRKR